MHSSPAPPPTGDGGGQLSPTPPNHHSSSFKRAAYILGAIFLLQMLAIATQNALSPLYVLATAGLLITVPAILVLTLIWPRRISRTLGRAGSPEALPQREPPLRRSLLSLAVVLLILALACFVSLIIFEVNFFSS